MGMDLKPARPRKDAPRDEKGRVIWGGYNWGGWTYICTKLYEWGVDTSEFSGCNDGELIKAKTCRAVAKAIEDNLHTLDERHQKWLAPHIELWRTCGGYRQY
jgi:hypothetical protein